MRVAQEWDADTIRRLFRQGLISGETPGWNERCNQVVVGVDACRHEHSPVTHVTRTCVECGAVATTAVPDARVFTDARQGLIPLEDAIRLGGMDPDTESALRAIPVCKHPDTASQVYRCVDGNPRRRCTDCGRVWSVERV